jgi:hypothetical protein
VDDAGWTLPTLKEHLTESIRALRLQVDANEKLHAALRESDKEAIDKAFQASEALAKQHNDLLRKNERLIDTFATREGVDAAIDQVTEARREQRQAEKEALDVRFTRLENWQAKITGGLVVIGAVGLSNFVRLWLMP